MKGVRILISIILSSMLFACCISCSNNIRVPIEDYEWSMATIQSMDYNGDFIAYDPEVAIDPEYSYAGQCTPMQMSCYVSDGKITIKNKTHNEVYYGTCELTENSRDSAIYEIAILEEKGTAVTAMTSYSDGTEAHTLIISMGGYTLNFVVANNEDDTEIGVIFQITLPLNTALQKQEFQSKNDLLNYINNNFTDCKYFYVFEDADKSEPTSNLTLDTENNHSYFTSIIIPENCWLIAHNIYKTSENTYYIKASLPITLNIDSVMEYSLGKNTIYSIIIDVSPQKIIK